MYGGQGYYINFGLDGQDIMCGMATGGGKSAVFAVPIIVLQEITRNPHLYPDLPTRALPMGIVITPTKGLASIDKKDGTGTRPRARVLFLNYF